MPANLKPKIKNVAAVAVHAELTRIYQSRANNRYYCVINGERTKSYVVARLLQTILMGIDGNAYAVAQGKS